MEQKTMDALWEMLILLLLILFILSAAYGPKSPFPQAPNLLIIPFRTSDTMSSSLNIPTSSSKNLPKE